jgi:ribosome biogenesis GTPase / thiamine phosphate phosphatase
MSDLSQDLTGQQLTGQDLTGTVVAAQANYYFVNLDPAPDQAPDMPLQQLLCTRRTRLKKIGQRVMVGDRVTVAEPDWQGKRGAIAAVHPRSSLLDRPPIANANQILLVFAIAEPNLDPNQLTRFLIKAESTGLDICLCLSKCDLIAPAMQQHWQQRLGKWGYPTSLISIDPAIGLADLPQRLRDRMTIVSGPSGVGKSSLINQLIPAVDLRVSHVSGKLGRGRHTTRHVELFELASGGLLADTPGFNQPDLDCTPEELPQYFPEIRARRAKRQCQFNDCRHSEEPGCGVRGKWERYPLYLQLLTEAIAHATHQQDQANPDATMKRIDRGNDQVTYEPRLNQHKYRQESRKSRKQSEQVMKGNVADFLGGSEDDGA